MSRAKDLAPGVEQALRYLESGGPIRADDGKTIRAELERMASDAERLAAELADREGWRAYYDRIVDERAAARAAAGRYREALERICEEFGQTDQPDAFDASLKHDPVLQVAVAALEESA